MKHILSWSVGLVLLFTHIQANATCYFGIENSGANIPPFIKGLGTIDKPFELIAGKDLCDITLVKKTEGTNLAYPNDKIYFQYRYKNIPLNYKGMKVNWLKIAVGVNQYSDFVPSLITDKNHPFDKTVPCKLIYDEKSSGSNDPAGRNQKYYDAVCQYSAPTGSSADTTFSGTINFSISINENKEIRRFADDNGQLQGGGTISVKWQNAPVITNFDLSE